MARVRGTGHQVSTARRDGGQLQFRYIAEKFDR